MKFGEKKERKTHNHEVVELKKEHEHLHPNIISNCFQHKAPGENISQRSPTRVIQRYFGSQARSPQCWRGRVARASEKPANK
jgi:hypothetical protein